MNKFGIKALSLFTGLLLALLVPVMSVQTSASNLPVHESDKQRLYGHFLCCSRKSWAIVVTPYYINSQEFYNLIPDYP